MIGDTAFVSIEQVLRIYPVALTEELDMYLGDRDWRETLMDFSDILAPPTLKREGKLSMVEEITF